VERTKGWELELNVFNCESMEPYECKNAPITSNSRPVGSSGMFQALIPAQFIPESVSVNVLAALRNTKNSKTCPDYPVDLGNHTKEKQDNQDKSDKSEKSKKEKKFKIEFFLVYNDKRSRLSIKEEKTFDQFKKEVKEKTKNFANDFTIQIGTGPNKNSFVNGDNDMQLLQCGETQIDLILKAK